MSSPSTRKAGIADIETIRGIERIEELCRAGHDALHRPGSQAARLQYRVSIAGASIEVSGGPPDHRIGRVYSFGIFEPATEKALDKILDALETAKSTQIRFRVPQTDQRAEITNWLLARGLRRSSSMVHWVAQTLPMRPTDTPYEIRRVRNGEMEEFGRLIALHYHLKPADSAEFHSRLEEMPGMACYMAFDGETAIATGANFTAGSGCIVEYGTTLGPYRRQGLQAAMIGYRLNQAAASGCEWACASTMGADRSSRNLVRQGFEKAYDTPVYTRN